MVIVVYCSVIIIQNTVIDVSTTALPIDGMNNLLGIISIYEVVVMHSASSIAVIINHYHSINNYIYHNIQSNNIPS